MNDHQLSLDFVNEADNDNSTPGIHGLNKNNNKLLLEVEAEDVCVGSCRENRCIDIGNNKDNNEDDTMILLRVQGADRRRLDKYKEKPHLTTILYGTFARNTMYPWSWRI